MQANLGSLTRDMIQTGINQDKKYGDDEVIAAKVLKNIPGMYFNRYPIDYQAGHNTQYAYRRYSSEA